MSGEYFIGLMSGTSLDGVDAALVAFNQPLKIVETYFLAYPENIKKEILALQYVATNELENAALVSNRLAKLYAAAVNQLLKKTPFSTQQIRAIGCHGQTIRHQPKIQGDIGYSLQIGNAALLAELTNINVVSDFRVRDIAAGGQGAPLVPAFHAEIFASPHKNRAIVNIGGIANITYIPQTSALLPADAVFGFDTGPGNMLIDAWVKQHLHVDFDNNGDWANSGRIIPALLDALLEDAFFTLPPPKSTGRDLFNPYWLEKKLANFNLAPQDVARTLTRFTARTIVDALVTHCGAVDEVYICGGGARNTLLMEDLQQLLSIACMHEILLETTAALNIDVDWVEAVAFAWLAKKCLAGETANLPAVTGAGAHRILGAITQA